MIVRRNHNLTLENDAIETHVSRKLELANTIINTQETYCADRVYVINCNQ